MNKKIALVVNTGMLLVTFLWGLWLLTKAKSKVDYLAAEVSRGVPLCKWISPGDASLATLGLSNEPGHSWTDRLDAYVVFKAPAMPSGGKVDLSIISLPAKSVELYLSDGGPRYQITKTGTYTMDLRPSNASKILALSIDSAKMAWPQGQDKRWLGVAISQIRVCAN